MADPVTLAGVSMGATALGGLTQAIGASYSGEAQAGAYTYKAGIAALNTQIAHQNADYERAAGEVSAQESGMRTRAEAGQAKAISGASSLDVNTGSKAALQSSIEEIGGENQGIIRSNAARRAYGYEVEATQFEAERQLDLGAAKMSRAGGTIGAISSLLGAGGSVASKWLQGNQIGLFSSNSGATDDTNYN